MSIVRNGITSVHKRENMSGGVITTARSTVTASNVTRDLSVNVAHVAPFRCERRMRLSNSSGSVSSHGAHPR